MLAWEPEIRPYLPDIFDKKAKRRIPDYPIAVEPAHLWRRISAQRSYFTVHGRDPDGLLAVDSAVGRGHLVKIVIPRAAIRRITRDLATCGICETTVFPDLEGLARELTSNWTRRPIQSSPLVRQMRQS